MTALRDTRSLRWQAALARLSARQRAVPASRPPVCYSPPANGLDAFHAAQARYLVRDALRYDRRNTPEARANRWAHEAFTEWYTRIAFRYPQLPAPPQQETRPVPEEAPAILIVDFAARALVQHPDALHEELAAAAQISDLPGLAGFPGGPQQQRGEAGSIDRPAVRPAVVPVESRLARPKTLGEAIAEALRSGPTRMYLTSVRGGVENCAELEFHRWTDSRLYFRDTRWPEAPETYWDKESVQRLLAGGRLTLQGDRPDWAVPVEVNRAKAIEQIAGHGYTRRQYENVPDTGPVFPSGRVGMDQTRVLDKQEAA